MSRSLLSLVALLFAPAPLVAQPPARVSKAVAASDGPIKIEGDTKVKPGHLVRLGVTGAADSAGTDWEVEPELADDQYETSADGRRLLFTAQPGVYTVRLLVIETVAGRTVIKKLRAVVTIGEPTPPPPPPDDPLVKLLRAAYDAAPEAPAEKVRLKGELAALCRGASKTIQKDPPHTAGEAMAVFLEAFSALLPRGALGRMNQVFADQLKTVLPVESATVLTDAQRAGAAALFLKFAAALEAIQ